MSTTEPQAPAFEKKLATARFTDEMLAEMRALIGTELRTEGSVNNEYADRHAILRFCEGIGDGNPLWTDPAYAATSVHGGIIVPPSFIFACLGSVQVGWRGLGGFHAETNMEFHKPIRVGDHIRHASSSMGMTDRSKRATLRDAGSRTTSAKST